MRNTLTAILFLTLSIEAFCQAPRFMRAPINSRTLNSIYPAISGNGSTLIYMNDYSDDNTFQILYTYKDEGRRWVRPAELDIVKPYRSVMKGGYCLDFDGETLMVSYTGGNSVGGFDLYESTLSNGKWSGRKNLGAPVNSSAHESYPALSPDGSKLYFTRCQGVLDGVGVDCQIMVADRKRGRFTGWEEPVPLPSIINSGNTMMPRILSDENSMYFRAGSGDNLKWYFTRFENDSWSTPESIVFLNVLEGKEFLSTYYRPDMVLTSIKNEKGYYNIADIRVPEQFQPTKAIIKSGIITNSDGSPMQAEIRALNFDNGETIVSASSNPENGEYSIILPEGMIYDYSIFPRRSAEMYFSTVLDYSEIRAIMRVAEDHQLNPVSDGTLMPINAIAFFENEQDIDPRSEPELNRLSRLIKDNESYQVTIHSYQDSIAVDSVARAELPLVISDTVTTYEVMIIPDSLGTSFPEMSTDEVDSLLLIWNDSLAAVKNDYDTLLANVLVASVTGSKDSVEVEEVKHTYHNDFTQLRGEALMEALVAKGVDAARLQVVAHGAEGTPQSTPESGTPAISIEIVFRKD